MKIFNPALRVLVLLSLLTGGVYPLVTTLLGQWWFPYQAQGSLIEIKGELRGSELIGQTFTEAKYFHSRPSATADTPYNPLASSGSNLAASNPDLRKKVTERIQALRHDNPLTTGAVPVELVTASGSGLDGQLSPQAVAWQIPRVAQARHLSKEQITHLVAEHTIKPWPVFAGVPVVNITMLNLALDHLQPSE